MKDHQVAAVAVDPAPLGISREFFVDFRLILCARLRYLVVALGLVVILACWVVVNVGKEKKFDRGERKKN